MAITTAGKNLLLNSLFGGIKVGLSITEPDANGVGSEPDTADGYSRHSPAMGAASGGSKTNSVMTFIGEATAIWGTLTHFIIFASYTTGVWTAIMYGALQAPLYVPANYVPLFRPNSVTFTIS